MITDRFEFERILAKSKEIEKYTIPNGDIILEVQSFVDRKLFREEIYQRQFEKLYSFMHSLLRDVIGLIKLKYGALPARLEPAKKLQCLFVSEKTHHTFATMSFSEEMSLIIPLNFLHKTPEHVEKMLIHECLHNCASVHHKEQKAVDELEKHQKEMREIISAGDREIGRVYHELEIRDSTALNDYLKYNTEWFAHYFLQNFYNIITDMGINVIVSLLNIRKYIESELNIIQHNLKNLNKVITFLKQEGDKIKTKTLYSLEFSLLVSDMPWSIFPFVYNRYYSAQAKALIGEYFSIVKKTSPEVQKRIERVYVDFFKVIKPHKVDLYKFNFSIQRIIHTEESISAAKILQKDIVSLLRF